MEKFLSPDPRPRRVACIAETVPAPTKFRVGPSGHVKVAVADFRVVRFRCHFLATPEFRPVPIRKSILRFEGERTIPIYIFSKSTSTKIFFAHRDRRVGEATSLLEVLKKL
jgi:hypothetical protein